MTRTISLAVFLLCTLTSLAQAGTSVATSMPVATFAMQDERAAGEIEETTELYIDGKLITSFRLDDTKPHFSMTVTVPGTPAPDGHQVLRYALCGTITIRTSQGVAEIHEVNATGLLHDPDGHRFEALGAANFTLFYLSDPTDPAAAESLQQHSGLCRNTIS